MIIECHRCESKVHASVLTAPHRYFDEGEFSDFELVIGACPSCENLLFGQQQVFGDGEDRFTGPAVRLWPDPEEAVNWHYPEVVRVSLEEARKCFKAAAYIACAVMCGRALEGMCQGFVSAGSKKVTLHGGLKHLLDNGTIDQKLYRWSEELRKHRNIGAHATAEAISKEDARDLLDFAEAICEYVYVMNTKFDAFMKRKADAAAAVQAEAKERAESDLPF